MVFGNHSLETTVKTERENSLFEKSLCLILVVVVHQLQIHVHKQRVEDL